MKKGYRVRGTVRDVAQGEALRAAMTAHGMDGKRLELITADLTSDAGWDEAVAGADFVQHVASPFPLSQPKDREALVPTAREGVLRIARLCRRHDVRRLVVTSSMVAMMYRADRPKHVTVSEDSWSDPEWSKLTPYIVSKTRAELALWDWASDAEWQDRVTTVNPGFVLGPAIDGRIGTSLGVIELILKGAYPALPPTAFPVVDVRDLAELHVRAMTREGVAGRRLIASSTTLTMADMAAILRRAHPERAKKIPTRELPAWLVRVLAAFDRTLRAVVPDLGVTPVGAAGYVTDLTGVTFRPADQSVRAAGQTLLDHGIVA